MNPSHQTKRNGAAEAAAAENLTYIGRYGCHAQYFKLKDCLSANTLEGKPRGQCDPLYDAIGVCILKSFRETNGEGVLKAHK